MENKDVKFQEKMIWFENGPKELDYIIDEALWVEGIIIVLYEYMQKRGRFSNVIAFDPSGKQLWTANLPTNDPVDFYVRIGNADGLTANSWSCFYCKLNLKNGKIIEKAFTK